MPIGRVERLVSSGDVELISVLPEGQRSDGTFVEVTVSLLTSDGEQHDIPLTPNELKNKARLRKLSRMIRRLGIMMLDTYELVGPAIAAPGAPSLPG